MVDGRLEEHRRGRIGVVCGEGEGQLQGEVLVRRLGRTNDGRRPREEVAICVGEGGDARGRREHELHQFRLKTV